MLKSKTKQGSVIRPATSPISVLTFDESDEISIGEEIQDGCTEYDELELLSVEDDRIKCGEIVLISNSRRCIRFTCSICGKELHRLDTFLRHTLQYHLLVQGEQELEDLLTAATRDKSTNAMENVSANVEHFDAVSEIMKLEKEQCEVVEEEEELEVDMEISYTEVELLDESLEHSVPEEQNMKMIASKFYDTEQLKNTQNIDGYENMLDDDNVGVKLDKLANTAYDELTECFEQDIEYNNEGELLEFVETKESAMEQKNLELWKRCTEKQMQEDEVVEIEFLNEENVAEATFKIPTSKELPYACEICNKSFRSHALLNKHARQHTNTPTSATKPYACEHCNSTFKDNSNLRVHRYRHLGIKPHQCALCEKAFISSSELKLHMRTHTGERPFKCPECGQTFVCSAHMTAHRRRHTNERAWVCATCGKAFYDRGQLREHVRGHSDYRPFACEECGISFTRRKSLVEHERLHAGIKKYYCKICKMAFVQNSGLRAHMRKKHHAVQS